MFGEANHRDHFSPQSTRCLRHNRPIVAGYVFAIASPERLLFRPETAPQSNEGSAMRSGCSEEREDRTGAVQALPTKLG
ncbi:hypothetical protein V5799_002187 [Amblyomma americanum]|uniref:Uncharacterized protein n=1 Tax=Amblyomma americanum TaxID=6943 RepID=A0AAQ4CY21_AMBAM